MRLLIVLPVHRSWSWHATLIAELRRNHGVTVVAVRDKPYPLALQILLRLERLIFGRSPHSELANSSRMAERVCEPADIDPREFECVVNLASAKMEAAKSVVLSPHYDGQSDDLFLIGRLLRRSSPRVGVFCRGMIIAESYCAVEDRDVLARSLSYPFSRMIALIFRALEAVGQETEAVTATAYCSGRAIAKYNLAALLWFGIRELAVKVSRPALRRLFRIDHWQIGVKRKDGNYFAPTAVPGSFKTLRLGAAAFFADPFLIHENQQNYLFAEMLPYRSPRRGVIVCGVLNANGDLTDLKTVLEQPYHLSYPHVFRHDGRVYMIPETSANGTVELYRCTSFPDCWTLDSVLVREQAISDATILNYGGFWWLFCSRSSFGGSTQDELFIYFAQSLSGPWNEHKLNPVVSDARFARPAGAIVEIDKRLIRPAQNCEKTYGGGITWFEIVKLSPVAFEQKLLGEWDAHSFGPYSGVHTYNETGEWMVIDLKQSMWRFNK